MSALGGAARPAGAGAAARGPAAGADAGADAGAGTAAAATSGALPPWWPLAALTLLAAALRLATLDLQGLWYDEAFTPVHVLHPGLGATLHAVVHTENSPPLWYLIEWLDSRILGTGAYALRLPSALAGIATVPVAWAIGRELAPGADGRSVRAATACAALVAVNPLFVWYSQEARVYGLFILMSALLVLTFVRMRSAPSASRAGAFAVAGALALATHYFAVFLLVPMAAVLLLGRAPDGTPGFRRGALAAVAAQGAAGLALLPLIVAQGGHGTQWIGRWPLSERVAAIPQYFLLGTSGEPLGHGIELLVAVPALGAVFAGLWYLLPRTDVQAKRELAGARDMALVAAGGVLIPLALAVAGSDYLAPRNLVGAMVPLTMMIALLGAAPAAGRTGLALVAATAVAFLAISLDVNFSPRLQRGDWRGVAKVLRPGDPRRAITTVELGAAPLEYYLPGLRNLARGATVRVREIDETGYAPLRAGAGRPPAPGFSLAARINVHGLITYRFVSPTLVPVTEAQLRREVITDAHPEALVTPTVRAATARY